MNLQHLQTSLCSLIKSRATNGTSDDDYINHIRSSQHLRLIQKIAHWWRQMQVESGCVLTVSLLKQHGRLEAMVAEFFKAEKFSPFREEVNVQFLHYLLSSSTDDLLVSVARFEFSLLRLKSGHIVNASIPWNYEPYQVINSLLTNRFAAEQLQKGKYTVEISSANKEDLFRVICLN